MQLASEKLFDAKIFIYRIINPDDLGFNFQDRLGCILVFET